MDCHNDYDYVSLEPFVEDSDIVHIIVSEDHVECFDRMNLWGVLLRHNGRAREYFRLPNGWMYIDYDSVMELLNNVAADVFYADLIVSNDDMAIYSLRAE